MHHMIWIVMVIAATLLTLLCGGYSIETVELAVLQKSASTKRVAILWSTGTTLSLLGLVIIILVA